MKLTVAISIPHLWGQEQFQKAEWSAINFLIGPNGTGKTLFADQLRNQCRNQALTTRHLNAERLVGLEKQSYHLFGHNQMERGLDIGNFPSYKSNAMNWGLSADAFVILREKLDVRIRIEATLSQLFARRIRLVEQGGFLVPKVQKIKGGDEYGLRESECHGLKELITLLTFVYDDENSCLIVDEPELHLHPQFQSFFLQEIRKMAGDPRSEPGKKCFFLITHSPYFLDIRTIDDLRSCVVFQPNKLPAHVDQLDKEDEWRIKKMLPRLNTHHKQFFFASRPIFVEGYFDQQLFALIQERRGKLLGASGSCLIDVGGKDELDVFFRLCKALKIEAQVIADLDAVLYGRLRQSVHQDERCRQYLASQGVAFDPARMVGEMESAIDECLTALETALTQPLVSAPLQRLREALVALERSKDDRNRTAKRRYFFLIGMTHHRESLASLIPTCAGKLTFIEGRLAKTLDAYRRAGVHLLPLGELENHRPGYRGNEYAVTDAEKLKAFELERDVILSTEMTPEPIAARYGRLVDILDDVSRPLAVNMDLYLNYVIGDWIHKVQSAVVRGEVTDAESLKKTATVEWLSHARIFDIMAFARGEHGFDCAIRLKPLIDPLEREINFDEKTVAANYRLVRT